MRQSQVDSACHDMNGWKPTRARGEASVKSRQMVLKSFPVGMPQASDFELIEADVSDLGEDEILVRTVYLSLDPYMRGRMSGVRSYADPAELGKPVPGEVVGQVVASRSSVHKEGDFVTAYSGWQSLAKHRIGETKGPAWGAIKKVDPEVAPISTAVGVLGMPGHTAYAGVFGLSDLKPGETLFVSAASGAVGSIVGQIAKIRGARAIGVAGSEEKIAYVTGELGFDGCFNHKGDLAAGFRKHAPKGIDVNFENVGGEVFWKCYDAMNVHGRIIVCGGIAGYNGPGENAPDRTMLLLGGLIARRLKMMGLLVGDWMSLRDDFVRDVSAWIRTGQLRYREDIVDGLENSVTAFQGLLQGRNFGKLLVRVTSDPTR